MNEFDIDAIIEKIRRSPPETIPMIDVNKIIEISKSLLIKEENIISLSSPIVIVGDIHGQLHDLFEVFRLEPPPPMAKFLFLGDYVDRGKYSVETILYLLCLKIKYPTCIYLLRGNHETRLISLRFEFYKEISTKYENKSLFHNFNELFDFLPIAALIDNCIFAVHGGLSPNIQILDQLQVLNRFCEPDENDTIFHLLWSDPRNHSGFELSYRKIGFTFGFDVAHKFAHLNNLVHIARGHEVEIKGYRIWFDGLLSTTCSNPNNKDEKRNMGSVMKLYKDHGNYSMAFNVFETVEK